MRCAPESVLKEDLETSTTAQSYFYQSAEKVGTSTQGQPAVYDHENSAVERGNTTVRSATAISTDAAK